MMDYYLAIKSNMCESQRCYTGKSQLPDVISFMSLCM